jgi:two-component system, NarL family, sensor histidine kinase UhpB
LSTAQKIRILMVEDSPTDALRIHEALADLPDLRHELIHVERLSDGLTRAREAHFDIVLLDLGLPDALGMDTFRTFHRHAADVPVLVLTGMDEISVGLQAIREGAQDYLPKKEINTSLLGRAIRYAIERHRVVAVLATSEERFELAVSGATAGLWDWDLQIDAMYFSPYFKRIMGYDEHELPNEVRAHQDAIHPDDVDRVMTNLKAHLEHRGAYDVEYRVRTQSGDFRWIQSRGQALWNASGKACRMVGWIIDITDRKHAEDEIRELNTSLERRVAELRSSLKEKEVLLQEIHHRVKNNLQIIASLLSLQSGYIRDPQMVVKFQESQGRIRSMALIYEKLLHSESLAKMDLADYVRSLADVLMRTCTDNANVTLESQLAPVPVSIDTAMPVGLMLNELVTNALKHAFPGGRAGQLLLALGSDADGQITLRVLDDGIGLTPGFQLEQASTLGLRLVRMFAKQLRARVSLHSEPGHTAFDIRFTEAVAESP